MNFNFYNTAIYAFFFLLISLTTPIIHAETSQSQVPGVSALYLSDLPDPNEFTLFATSGWDGGWFVGYSKIWVQEIEVPENTHIKKAFIGAKLGRMKVKPQEGRPAWESTAIPGTIYIAISSTDSWNNAKTFPLTSTRDIPYEGVADVALIGVGGSRWFWVEVPIEHINFGGKNYLALWSSNEKFTDSGSSPIIAAGWDIKDKKKNTWLIKETEGKLPDESFERSPISYFDPALAIKLVPDNAYSVFVHLKHITSEPSPEGKLYFAATVTGVNIEKVWIEISKKGKKWSRHNRFLYNTPYIFTLDPATLPQKRFILRAVAQDELGNTGYSDEIELENK